MPSYRFSWDTFNDRTVLHLANAIGFDGPFAEARKWLSTKVKRPTPEFVGETKEVLQRAWLPEYAGAKEIVERLLDIGIGPMGRPRSQRGYVGYIKKCRNSKRLRQYLCEAMIRYGDQDNQDEGEFDGYIRVFQRGIYSVSPMRFLGFHTVRNRAGICAGISRSPTHR